MGWIIIFKSIAELKTNSEKIFQILFFSAIVPTSVSRLTCYRIFEYILWVDYFNLLKIKKVPVGTSFNFKYSFFI